MNHTRTIARLEARFGARLFERLPTGVRLTALGETAVELARGPLREIDAAVEKFGAAEPIPAYVSWAMGRSSV